MLLNTIIYSIDSNENTNEVGQGPLMIKRAIKQSYTEQSLRQSIGSDLPENEISLWRNSPIVNARDDLRSVNTLSKDTTQPSL